MAKSYSKIIDKGCVALCEVINKDIIKKIKNIWVIKNEQLVVTRFLFIYDRNPRFEVKCSDKNFIEIIYNILSNNYIDGLHIV